MVNNPDTIFVLLLLFLFCERHNRDIGRAPSQAMTKKVVSFPAVSQLVESFRFEDEDD